MEACQALDAAVAETDLQTLRHSAHKLLGILRMAEIRILPDHLRRLLDAAAHGREAEAFAEWRAFRERFPSFPESWRQPPEAGGP